MVDKQKQQFTCDCVALTAVLQVQVLQTKVAALAMSHIKLGAHWVTARDLKHTVMSLLRLRVHISLRILRPQVHSHVGHAS